MVRIGIMRPSPDSNHSQILHKQSGKALSIEDRLSNDVMVRSRTLSTVIKEFDFFGHLPILLDDWQTQFI